MPLESLMTRVEKIRKRMDDHGDALRQNEMSMRPPSSATARTR